MNWIFEEMRVSILSGLSLGLLLVPFSAWGVEPFSMDGWEDAYSRRNFQLGITLQEFRSIPFPDQKLFPDAHAVCSNELEEGDYSYPLAMTFGEIREAGIVKCHHYYRSPIFGTEEAKLLIADWGAATAFYFVKPDGQKQYFLFKIVSTSRQPIFDQLFAAYTAAMGSDPSIMNETVQNKMGARFTNVIAVWENPVSSIRLEKYHTSLDHLAVIHTLKPLNQILEKRIEAINKKRGQKL